MDDWNVTLHRLQTPVQSFIDSDRSPTYDSPDHATETFQFAPVGSTHVPAIADFADAILQDREPAITGEDGLRSQELVAAATLSARANRPVAIPTARPAYDALHARLAT